MRRALLPLTMAATLVAFAAPPVAAFTGIDQRQEDTSRNVFSGNQPSGETFAQTFTAGMGGRLAAVGLSTGRSLEGRTLRIETAASGVPTGTVLATATIGTSATGWIKVPLRPAPAIEAGTQYAIVIHVVDVFILHGGHDDSYGPGTVSWEVAPGDWLARPWDFAFRTWVRTASEPAFSWVSAPTKPRAGGTATYRFSLGGFFGYDVIKGGSPTTTRVDCSTGTPIKGTTFKARPLGGSIAYDAELGQYVLRWKVRPQWAKGALACRTFEVHIRGERDPHVVTVKVRKPAT